MCVMKVHRTADAAEDVSPTVTRVETRRTTKPMINIVRDLVVRTTRGT